MQETSHTLRVNLSVSSPRALKRTANLTNLDFTLSLHQLQVTTVMVKLSLYVSKDSSMMTMKARKLKVSAQTTSATSSQEMKL